MDATQRRTFVGLFISGAACLVIGGCLVFQQDRPPTTVLMPGNYTAQIERAAGEPLVNERGRQLRELAAKPDLNEADQLRIIEVMLNTANSEDANRDVLLALLAAPTCTQTTRDAIARHTELLLVYDADRSLVREALAK